MAEEKVCLLTAAATTTGQRVIKELVKNGHKVIALADVEDMFSPDILKKSRIKITTALPMSAALFKKNDVQISFGDINDISFLASVFFAAARGGVDIEYIIHLPQNTTRSKTSLAVMADFGSANIIEVARAYWQSNKESFKGFFYALDTNKKSAAKTEEMLSHLIAKEHFPVTIFRGPEAKSIVGGYMGKTALSSLYRLISPVPSSVKWEDPTAAKDIYLSSLLKNIRIMLEK